MKSIGSKAMLLAGDVGGTKTALAIYAPEAGPRAPIFTSEFQSADYPGLESIVHKFPRQTG